MSLTLNALNQQCQNCWKELSFRNAFPWYLHALRAEKWSLGILDSYESLCGISSVFIELSSFKLRVHVFCLHLLCVNNKINFFVVVSTCTNSLETVNIIKLYALLLEVLGFGHGTNMFFRFEIGYSCLLKNEVWSLPTGMLHVSYPGFDFLLMLIWMFFQSIDSWGFLLKQMPVP